MIEVFVEMIIRKKVREGNFDLTKHALERMTEREIEIESVGLDR